MAHKEYEKAGVPMLPVTHGAKATRLQILLYTVLLVPIGLAPVFTGLGGWIYAVIAGGLGLAFLYGAIVVFRGKAGDIEAPAADLKRAKNLFLFSILYLFVIFAALLVEHATGLHFRVMG